MVSGVRRTTYRWRKLLATSVCWRVSSRRLSVFECRLVTSVCRRVNDMLQECRVRQIRDNNLGGGVNIRVLHFSKIVDKPYHIVIYCSFYLINDKS